MALPISTQGQGNLPCQDLTDSPPGYPTTTASDTLSLQASSAPPSALKRHKRYAPKVRTGCLTCKKRRVKCDETKPKCLKCLNSDYQCDGYSVPKAWIFEGSPKDQSPKDEEGASSGEEKALTLSPTPPPSSHSFTPDEARSIQFYLRRSGRMVAKYDHSRFSFWMDALPQAAHRFDSVKHVLVATALQDELLTSPTTIPKIERRIAYHYQQALQKTVYTKPTIDHILLNCLSMYYFDCLRDNIDLIILHLESARKIIDEWRAKDEKSTLELHDLVNVIDGIVTEARAYSQTTPSPPIEPDIDWDRLPNPDPYDSAEDAEHALIACLGNLCRCAGQVPLALIRANVFLSAWRNDSREALKKADTDTTLNMAALFQIAKDTIHLLNKASPEPQDKRWFQLLRSVQEMPRLRSIKYRKPVTALENMLQQTSETKEQADAVIALHRHLQRGIVYDG